MSLSDAEIAARLATWPVAHLATIDADGRPHLVPIVFARTGGALWSPIDGKPKRDGELARVRNIERDPRVTLLLDHYDAEWTKLWWIRIAGHASLVAGNAAAEAALRAKYPQYATTPLFRNEPLLVRIVPASTKSWSSDAERGASG